MRIKQGFLLLAVGLVCCIACTKEVPDSTFTLIGTWGMDSGTITNGDGTTKRYDNLGGNTYYQYLEYKVDGTLIQTSLPNGTQKYGVYSYNDASRELSYKYDGDLYYYPASVNIISAKEMIITTDYGSSGRITQHMIKLSF